MTISWLILQGQWAVWDDTTPPRRLAVFDRLLDAERWVIAESERRDVAAS